MKKKLVLVIILVLASAFVLAACDGIFVINAEKDYRQTVVDITYGGYTSTVKKGDLEEYFASNAGQYLQQGVAGDEVLEYFTDSLSKNELYTMKAMEWLNQQGKVAPEHKNFDEMTTLELEAFLDYNEICFARKTVNGQFDDAFAELLADYQKDDDTTDDEDDEEEADTPRKQAPDTSATFDRTLEKSLAEVDEEGFWIDRTGLTRKDEAKWELSRWSKKSFTTNEEKRAWRKMEKNMNSPVPGYRNYDYFYKQQLRTRILDKFMYETNQEYLDGLDLASFNEEVLKSYNRILKENYDAVTDDASFETLFDGTSTLLYQRKGYENNAKVRSLLLGFTQEQKDVIAKWKKMEYVSSKTDYYNLLAQMAFDFSDSSAITNEYGVKTGLSVKVSNIYFDTAEKESDENLMYTNEKDADGEYIPVPFYEILDELSASLTAAKDGVVAGEKDPEQIRIEEIMYQLKAFDDMMYKVNDDPGMYAESDGSLNSYSITPEGKTSSFVPEYRDTAREVALGGLGSVSINTNNSTRYTLSADGFAGIAGLQQITKIDAKDTGFAFQYKGITFNLNEHGLHVVFVTQAYTGDDLVEYNGTNDAEGWKLKPEAIYDYGYKYAADTKNDNGVTVINFRYDYSKKRSVSQVLYDTMQSDMEYENTSRIEREFFAANEAEGIKRNARVFDELMGYAKSVS